MILQADTSSAAGNENVSPDPNPLKKKAFSSIGKLPPFSPVLNKLLATLAGEDASFAKLGELIEKDTIVAGNVLQVVNSAIYARRNEITSVRHALSILGIEKIRNLVLGMSISRMMKQAKPPAPLTMKLFNKHSAAVAILSDQLAQHVPCNYPEGAFVAGLLHDVGRLLVALGLPSQFDRTVAEFRRSEKSWVQCEMELLGFSHANLSADILEHWKLPVEIQVAVRDHHGQWPLNAASLNAPAPLARLVEAADQYVNATGVRVLDLAKLGRSPEVFDHSNPPRIAMLGLTDETLGQILANYETECAAMSEFFG